MATPLRYGQFCGLARAMELVGEPWAMLVVRDLLLGPKSVDQLHRTLPRVPAETLSARLHELATGGVVRPARGPGEDTAGAVYELTEYGKELDEIVVRFGLWGARSLGEPAEGDMFSLDTAILSLYTMFRQEAAHWLRVTYEIHFGATVVHAIVDDGELTVAEGPCPDVDLVIEVLGNIKPMYAGEITAEEALADGLVRVRGDSALLARFTELFVIPTAPVVPHTV
jgi:DNA-binding HxlR family transcriptional regulator/putative sterol carrier protein